MEVIIHKEMASLEEIFPKWEQLQREFHEITVFQDIEWLKTWWEYKLNERKIIPYIVEVKKENKTIGILPLFLYNKEFAGLSFRVLKPIGIDQSDYLIPIISKNHSPIDIIKKAMEKIYTDKDNWDCLDWGDIPEGSIFDSIFNTQLLNEYSSVERKRTDDCPYITLKNKKVEEIKHNMDEELLKEILSKERKLNNKGTLTFTKVSKEEEIEPIMNKFFELHCERWSRTDTPSKFRDLKEREFALLAAKNLFKDNLLFLAYLSHNNEIIAVQLGMLDGKRIYLYIPAFNIKYKKYSVGNLLNYYIILMACQERYDIIDFLRGNEKYKQEWGTITKFNVNYVFFNRSISSLLFKMIQRTYYSKQFNQKPINKQLLTKSVIRGFAFLLRITSKFKVNKGIL